MRSPPITRPTPSRVPPSSEPGPCGPPPGGLASPWGARATNGRANWGKLTRSKTPQHLEKQEPGWGRAARALEVGARAER
jgi:hypothetical protein